MEEVFSQDQTEDFPMSKKPGIKTVLAILAVLLLADIVFLNFKSFSGGNKQSLTSPITVPAPSPQATTFIDGGENVCPDSCLLAISESTAQAKKSPLLVAKESEPAGVKEIYIPLGSGSTKNSSWSEIHGAESVIDLANYPNIKSAIFESSLKIPTANGNVSAKLFNVTDQHDVWGSEVSSEGSTSFRAESANINLSSGRKLYRVMMKSSMSYEAVLDWARIKIILQ